MADGKYWQVIKATTKPGTGVQAAGRNLRFGKEHAFQVTDEAVAKEIDAKYGKGGAVDPGSVVVVPRWRGEAGHRYFFGNMPEMPWKRKKESKDEIQ